MGKGSTGRGLAHCIVFRNTPSMTYSSRYALRETIGGALLIAALWFEAEIGSYRSVDPGPESREPIGAGHGEPELRVCTQNLHDYAVVRSDRDRWQSGQLKESLHNKIAALVERMTRASCDVVGVQEVGGETAEQALRNLQFLAEELGSKTRRKFVAHVGEVNAGPIRAGVLIAADVATVLEVKSERGINLPSLFPLGPAHKAPRVPLLVRLRIAPRSGAATREFVFVTVHLKSKVDGWKDPTGTDFEAVRMESAEAVRQQLEAVMVGKPAEAVAVIMGDFNSNPGHGAMEIVAGRYKLADFSKNGECRLDEKLRPECKRQLPRTAAFVPLFGSAVTKGNNSYDIGRGKSPEDHRNANPQYASFLFRGKPILLDEVFVSKDDLELVTGDGGKATIGTEGRFHHGSDHKLMWVEFNW